MKAKQMSKDLSQLMKDKLMKMIVEQRDEMIMLRSMNQRMEQLSADVNEYMIQMLDQPTPESHHIDISTDRYNDAHNNLSTDISILLKMLLMKKLKILTHSYLLMNMLMMLNDNIKFYLLMMI